MKNVRLMLGVVVAGSLLTSAHLFAKESANTNPFKKTLRDVPVLELPAQAASLIKQAKETEREATTIQVIGAISELKPAAVSVVVGTIARTTPTQAATAAAAATQFQPEMAVAFVKSATTVAPKMASRIVTETCRRAPRQFQGIAIAASQAVPSASLEILAAVSSAIPEIKPAIQEAMAASKSAEPAVEVVVKDVPKFTGPIYLTAAVDPKYPTVSAPSLAVGGTPAPSAASGPIVGLPFKPLPPGVTEMNPGSTYEVPTGGRNYATP